jgi:hypothetical protein
MDNSGGHFSHIGGMVMGWLFINLIQHGNDPSDWINKRLDYLQNIFTPKQKATYKKRKSPLKVSHKASIFERKSIKKNKGSSSSDLNTSQHKLDTILDKISQKGIESLSQEEKDFLDQVSKK